MDVLIVESILLFTLSVPIIMGYKVLPTVNTPYWLFGLLFGLLIVNIIISLYQTKIKNQRALLRLKTWIVWSVIAIVLGGVTLTAIVDRSKTAPVYGVHDIILQQEAAMRYLIEGKNPYKETYFGTPMESWNYDEMEKEAINPALYHFVMPPWYLLFPFFFYAVMIPTAGFFDGRVTLLFAMVGLLFIISRWFKDKKLGLLAMTLTALSPASVDYFIEGRSDIFALFWFVWSVFLMDKKKFLWSGILLALALASKQTIWPAIPVMAAYLACTKKSLIKTTKYWVTVGVVFLLIIVPFLAWDAKAFVDSVILYLNGATANGYPVSGYGLGMVLFGLGIIRDVHAYYPFILWQLVVTIPVIFLSYRWLKQSPTTSKLLISYAFVLFAFWYTSRYFNNSHVGYLASVFVLGGLKHLDESEV